MKSLIYDCPRCGMHIRVQYTLGDGGIRKIICGDKCPICLTEISQEDVVNHIIDKDDEL